MSGLELPDTFPMWENGEPSNSNENDFCVMMWSDVGHRLDDSRCGDTNIVLCEQQP